MSTSVSTTTRTQGLAPYIFFYGRCGEALEFYKKAIGGSYEAQRQEGSDKIMHATFSAPGITLLCSDGSPERFGERIDPEVGNIALSLHIPDRAKGERVFAALADGGTIKVPLDEVPWGGEMDIQRFGIIHDKFGNEWMVTTP
jgi:PhnB protein